jgi:hypothetical protein
MNQEHREKPQDESRAAERSSRINQEQQREAAG